MDLTEIRPEVVDWIHLAQERDKWQSLMNMVINFHVPGNKGNLLAS
jgi:hypothetical protein